MYVRVFISLKEKVPKNPTKVVNRQVRSIAGDFVEEGDTGLKTYIQAYHENRGHDVANITLMDISKSDILWEGNKLCYFVYVYLTCPVSKVKASDLEIFLKEGLNYFK
jgi:hypothetical protein